MNRWSVDGQRLRKRRIVAGLSAHDIAVRMSTSSDTVTDGYVIGIESGYRRFKTQAAAQAYVDRFVAVCVAAEKVIKPGEIVTA